MRTHEEYKQILAYAERGYNPSYISRLTGIPRRTVIDCIRRYGTLEGYESALAANPTPILLNVLKQQRPDENGTRKAYAYVLGIYLGDGCISKARRVYRIRIALDARYPNIIHQCVEAIRKLVPDNQVSVLDIYNNGHLSLVNVSAYYAHWCQVFPQHGEGAKHDRPIILEDWQMRIVEEYPLEFFRGLYHSDGSRFINRVNGYEYPRYQFTNKSKDILQLFCVTTDRLGLHWTFKGSVKRGSDDIFISRRADVAFLDQHIGPKS